MTPRYLSLSVTDSVTSHYITLTLLGSTIKFQEPLWETRNWGLPARTTHFWRTIPKPQAPQITTTTEHKQLLDANKLLGNPRTARQCSRPAHKRSSSSSPASSPSTMAGDIPHTHQRPVLFALLVAVHNGRRFPAHAQVQWNPREWCNVNASACPPRPSLGPGRPVDLELFT